MIRPPPPSEDDVTDSAPPTLDIHLGDNLDVLAGLADESFELIYIDPPFNTGKTQARTRIRTVRDPNGDRRWLLGCKRRSGRSSAGTKKLCGYSSRFSAAGLDLRLKKAMPPPNPSRRHSLEDSAVPADHDPEFGLLTLISGILELDHATADPEWRGSPFAWIRNRSAQSAGAIGERLLVGWLASHDFSVGRTPDSSAGRIIEGRRAEVKLSTRWAKNGIYKFQQIRGQDYDCAVFLGLCPFDAHCWAVPKAELMTRWADPDAVELTAQHGGKKGQDTAWLSFPHDAPPAWLAPFGGPLRDGLRSISRLTGFDLPAVGEEE